MAPGLSAGPERELQKIDPSVTLPSWRFDQPAPNAFTADFMGLPGPGDTVVFSGTNLLRQWQTDGTPGVTREPGFNVQTARANVISQARTLSLGDDRPNAIFDRGPTSRGLTRWSSTRTGNAHTSCSTHAGQNSWMMRWT
jgi:tyrosinase